MANIFNLDYTAKEINEKLGKVDENSTKLDNINEKIDNLENNSNGYMTTENPTGTGAFSMGRKPDTIMGVHSFAVGDDVTASGDHSHAEGYRTVASNLGSHAEGALSTASGEYSHAEGWVTKATGDNAHAEGSNNTASGHVSHTEGYGTKATSKYAHAEGESSTASGIGSHAEGYSVNAKGDYSHSEGNATTATGYASHAGGRNSKANKEGSFAHGRAVTADAAYQATFGSYNEVNTNTTFIIGNGDSSSTKSNAFEVNKNGNTFVKGDLFVGKTGAEQGLAKQVATTDSIDTINTRLDNVEQILTAGGIGGGNFLTDSEIAYTKVIPDGVASYAALNKLGGLSIYENVLPNLLPSTYSIPSGTSDGGDYTLTYDSQGVIKIKDACVPEDSYEYEPWFGCYFDIGDIELSPGTYTISVNRSGAGPIGVILDGSFGQTYVGCARDYEVTPDSFTFTLTQTETIDIAVGYSCSGGYYMPSTKVEYTTLKIMLNIGSKPLPWTPYSTDTHGYTELPKVKTVDVYGKNLFDYGEPRNIHEGDANVGYEQSLVIEANGTLYIENHNIPVEFGPGSEYGENLATGISINSNMLYPAGVYSTTPAFNYYGGTMSLELWGTTLSGKSVNIIGNNNVITEPFTLKYANAVYYPSELTWGVSGVTVPLLLVRGETAPTEPIPFEHYTLTIPDEIVSRDDYGLGVYTKYGPSETYSNYIDFERKKYVKNCLVVELDGYSTQVPTNGSKINLDLAYRTFRCSDPSVSVEVYCSWVEDENYSWHKPTVFVATVDGLDEDASNAYIQSLKDNGTPIKVFFGTDLTEEIDISEELKGFDNYISTQPGGMITFTNNAQEAVVSEIEYQLN